MFDSRLKPIDCDCTVMVTLLAATFIVLIVPGPRGYPSVLAAAVYSAISMTSARVHWNTLTALHSLCCGLMRSSIVEWTFSPRPSVLTGRGWPLTHCHIQKSPGFKKQRLKTS